MRIGCLDASLPPATPSLCRERTRRRLAGRHARTARGEEDEMAHEKSILPLSKSKTTSCHRVSLLLFSTLTEDHVPPLSDDRASLDAGPQLSEMEYDNYR
jgi:hypothetical protein